MKTPTKYFIAIFAIFSLFSCENHKHRESNDLAILRNNRNNTTYPTAKLDSAQAINAITKQKLQELFDLSAIYASGKKDSEIDSLNYNQIQGYFIEKDSNNVLSILHEIDSLKARYAKINKLEVAKDIKGKDTLDIAKFSVEYLDKNQRKVAEVGKTAIYKLQKSPVKFKREFKFYFVNIDVKDTLKTEKTVSH